MATAHWQRVRSHARQVLACIGDSLSFAHSIIASVIDYDQVDEGMLVAHGVCEELDEMKATYQVMCVAHWQYCQCHEATSGRTTDRAC